MSLPTVLADGYGILSANAQLRQGPRRSWPVARNQPSGVSSEVKAAVFPSATMTAVIAPAIWRNGGVFVERRIDPAMRSSGAPARSMNSKGVEVHSGTRDSYSAGYGLTWSVRLKHDRDTMDITFDLLRSVDNGSCSSRPGCLGIAAEPVV
ncbi:MAG: hypothetical protein WB615_05875 [Candidatus Tumulicola sp.]